MAQYSLYNSLGLNLPNLVVGLATLSFLGLGLGFGIKACIYGETQLIETDLNHNNEPERFYVIDGKKCFIDIDNENLESKL